MVVFYTEHMPPPKNASYGALISIVLILFIIVVGAFYVWGERISQRQPVLPITSTTTVGY